MPGAMNQYPDAEQFSFKPDLSAEALATSLAGLLVPGVIRDRQLERHCCRLDERFRIYASTCPVPEWAPGLLITAEIRRQHELYLPLEEIGAAFAALCRLACRYPPLFAATVIAEAQSWPDALARMHLSLSVNPARLLRMLAECETLRFAFLAAIFIPRSFGGSFNRYPQQAEFLNRWLAAERERLQGRVAILDAACGCGEGTYEAAAAVYELGYAVSLSTIEGSTLEPLELVAAAHGWFPADAARGRIFRERVQRLLAGGAGEMIHFNREDLRSPRQSPAGYDVIICNGLLGGPLLHEAKALAEVAALLTARLKPGGILLAADHFHEGWKQKNPPATLAGLLTGSGLQIVDAGEGLAVFQQPVRTG